MMKAKLSSAAVLFALAAILCGIATRSTAATITYIVKDAVGIISINGSLTTDGKLGVRSTDDFLSWQLTLSGRAGFAQIYPADTTGFDVVGSNLTATSSALMFDYDTDTPGTGYFFIVAGKVPAQVAWAPVGVNGGQDGPGGGITPLDHIHATFLPQSGILPIATVVPELPAWAMIILGFGGLGFAGSRRKS
jgi:hypothetical protein